MHTPFLDVDALADHQVQSHLDQILDDVQHAKEPDNELEDKDNPAVFWDNPCFNIPDPVDIARKLIFNLPKSPGKIWLDEWFQDAIRQGLRKQRGDLVYAVAKYHEKIFNITDPAFEDHLARREIPEVQQLSTTFMHTAANDPLDVFFKDECIVQVLQLLLNGHSAIHTGHRSSKSCQPHVEMWHIKFITPSLLAFAATVIKFVLSGEPSFKEASGAVNYTKWYLARLGLLEGIYADKPNTYNALINYYNREVLPDRYCEVRFEHHNDDNAVVDYHEGMNDEEWAFLDCVIGVAEN
ncbi:hypothetical protein FRC10_010693 [Ceratobasidium sp. 414]|nr:hypothetical protein FRC10_010693 [Ceratobasidium sp. 414]